MPYIPQGSTPAQRDAFAQRLTRHLLSPDSRSSLMALREAFARAGGFPNAHAAAAAIKQDAVWANPFSVIGRGPSKATPAYRFLGIHPSKLFEWAKVAWRKNRQLLFTSPFTADMTRTLLADLWGFSSWDAALRFHRTTPLKKGTGLLLARTMAGLHELASSGRGNSKGLHISLGTTTNDQLVGLDFSHTLTHTLMLDEDRSRRYNSVNTWISHRINSNDGIFVVDASVQGTVGRKVQQDAMECSRRVHVFDLTVDDPQLPWIGLFTAGGLTDLLFSLTTKDGDGEDIGNAIISWLAMVSIRQVASWRCADIPTPHGLIKAMVEPPESLWWKRDVGISSATQEPAAVKMAYAALPKDWNRRVKELNPILSSQCFSRPELTLEDLRRDVVVFKLPQLIGAKPHSLAHKKLILVSCFYKDYLAQGLGEAIEDYRNIIEEPEPLANFPTFHINMDVPFSLMPRGHSTTFAQSRSMAVSILNAGPAVIVSGGTNEARSMIANTGTKIFHSQSSQLHSVTGLPQLPSLQNDQAVIVRGTQLEVFYPHYMA